MGNNSPDGAKLSSPRWWPSLPKSAADWEFTSILFGRPLAAVLLYPVRAWISPNLVTLLSLILAIAAVPMLLFHVSLPIPLALLFFSMVLDDGDGLVARYQGRTSLLGSFWDKGADVIRFGLIFPAIGYIAFVQTGKPLYLLLGGLTPFGLMVQGYTKWLYEAHMKGKEPSLPSSSPTTHWGKGLAVAVFWPFHECDLTVWIIVLFATSHLSLLVHVLCWSQLLAGLLSLVTRTLSVASWDRKNA